MLSSVSGSQNMAGNVGVVSVGPLVCVWFFALCYFHFDYKLVITLKGTPIEICTPYQ